MQSKINMLNEILLSKLENELTGKYVSYTKSEKKELNRQYRWYFGKDEWKGSIFAVYQEFLQSQARKGKTVPFTENAFDLYDLAALAYLYKRIKETDRIREASHVIIDEAQDFGMMVYGSLAFCLRGCTYTIMGDVSQNIHYGYGLNDWKELQELILTSGFDSFGLLKKSYRNTVEISDFATEILRHGNFSIYPVEPIIRHGNDVRIEECSDEDAMLLAAVKTIQGWQEAGHETIAVICRDEAEASDVSSRMEKHLAIADSDLETAEFGSGIMVLPVEYTKGLEFDCVLLYHPSAQSYPAEDQYVKLLYVAATRALHELTVLHQGDLSELIAVPVSEKKRMQLLENVPVREEKEYKKREITAREQELLDVRQGDKEREMRLFMGPKPIEIPKAQRIESKEAVHAAGTKLPGGKDASTGRMTGAGKTANRTGSSLSGVRGTSYRTDRERSGAGQRMNQAGSKNGQPVSFNKSLKQADEIPVNLSPYQFRDVPDTGRLQPGGHGRIDSAVRMVRKSKSCIDLISSYGMLRLTPLQDEMIRVQFLRGRMGNFAPGYWDYKPEKSISWSAKEGKNLVEIATAKLTVRIDKKTGALLFYDKKGTVLLAEKAALPRRVEPADRETWVYFDWPKKEKLSAKGMLSDDLERMDHKARYISFGGKRLRMPLLVSEYGYGIGVAAQRTVLCCNIPMYGPYLYTDGTEQIDYYFLYGETYEGILELYKKL